MKCKLSIGIFVALVSMIMLMSNTLATLGPGAWINQATLSPVDYRPDIDPENSGFGPIQAVVWENWNGANWDIWMKYSVLDGALGSWIFPPIQPATSPLLNEINPAVTVTNFDPITGVTEIHIVYQIENPVFPPTYDIHHIYTFNFGIAWTVPWVLDNIPANDAIDPAIVYTDDHAPGPRGGGFRGMLVQFVWAEFNPITMAYEIYYDAFYNDPSLAPIPRGYIGATLVRASPGGSCEVPEIASLDETANALAYDYYFVIVWQEPIAVAPFNINIWYIAGTTTTSPGAPVAVPNAATLGPLTVNVAPGENCYDPDIAATQDYQVLPIIQQYYFHVNWVHYMPAGPGGVPPQAWQIDNCMISGGGPAPPAAVFIPLPIARGPVNILLNRPTIASKLIAINPPATIFETWMCWEDSNVPGSAPDIWFRMGQHTVGGPIFGWIGAAARVPYIQPIGSTEFNPELWNRNDAARVFPPFTHLVFDMSTGLGGNQEVEYIDP